MGTLRTCNRGVYRRINAFNLLSHTDHDADGNDGNNRENQGIFHEGLPPATSGPPQLHRHPYRIKKNRPFDFDHATHLLSWINPKGMAEPASSRLSLRDTLTRARFGCDRNHGNVGTTMLFLDSV